MLRLRSPITNLFHFTVPYMQVSELRHALDTLFVSRERANAAPTFHFSDANELFDLSNSLGAPVAQAAYDSINSEDETLNNAYRFAAYAADALSNALADVPQTADALSALADLDDRLVKEVDQSIPVYSNYVLLSVLTIRNQADISESLKDGTASDIAQACAAYWYDRTRQAAERLRDALLERLDTSTE